MIFNKKTLITILLILILTILSLQTIANEDYSFEKAEELTPLIHWRDYGPDAFIEAQEQNKPIFLLLTAPSWCYWCQVYESVDYLFHPLVVDYVNNNTIPIYVDADQRYDLTRQYLEGGWPSTTVLTPAKERLYGFSGPRPPENMIANLKNAVEHVNNYKSTYNINYNYQESEIIIPTNEILNNLIQSYSKYNLQVYDPEHGGFGTGQKFPQGRTLDFALELYETTNEKHWLDLVQNTLENQYTEIDKLDSDYNLFDPVDGGFHRYGTTRHWTPPHYEKMLYDNARLLKAYYHLLTITPEDELTKEVVEKTLNFIQKNWYDSENGGFYGNSDVHGEEAYFGKYPRPQEEPRVEKTKYTNWNSEAILTYLYLYQVSSDEKYKEMSEKSLDFFQKEMITKNGAYHYEKDGKKEVRGNLLDNSYLLLAFIEGYETLRKEKYLKTSEQLADYSLNTFYDWNSSGFFERNSPDIQLYAPGENILLSKPNEENGIIAYALLKLYRQTNDPIYLVTTIKTIGTKITSVDGIDRGYYFIKASQFILQNNLLEEYHKLKDEVKGTEEEKKANFWLNEILSNSEFKFDETGLEKLQTPLLLLIFIAVLAGFISFASPCSLPIIPAFIAYSFRSSKKNIFGMTIFFFLGLSLLFTILGMSASLIGNFLKQNLQFFSIIAGLLLMLFGIYILFGKGFSGLKIKNKKPTTYLGSFLFGVILGISWTPCVGPILVSILLLASTSGTILNGGILLFMYAFGFAIPLLLFSFYLNKINRKGKFWTMIQGKEIEIEVTDKKNITLHTSSLISGLIFIILGYLIFSGKLIIFNQFLSGTPIQMFILKIEDFIINLIK